MKIHHIGIKVDNIEKNIFLFEKLGYKLEKPIVFDHVQSNKIALLRDNENFLLELIEPINDTSTIKNASYGYHHICYLVESYSDFILNFKKMKIGKIFTKFIEAPAFNHKLVLFSCLQNGILVEFLFEEED